MKFEPVGVIQGEAMDKFRDLWIIFTGQENGYLSKVFKDVSPMQRMIIDMTTGKSEPYANSEDMVIVGQLPAQMEVEALVRARSRALAVMLQGSQSQ